MDERRNQKDFMSVVAETYKDFAQNTSIHGLKYTVRSGIVIYEKIFWIIVVLLGLFGAGYMTILFWERYTSNPTRTSIMTSFAPTTAVAFPAVSICNINRIMGNKVDQLVKKLDIPVEYREIVNRALPQLLAFTNPSAIDYNATELNILQKVLENNDFFDTNLIMRKLSQNCKEMLLICRWNFDMKNCSNLFKESLTPDGLCCSFNYDFKQITPGIHSPYNGFRSGLAAILNPMFQPVQYSALHSEGLKITLHSPGDYPGVGSVSKIIAGGRENYLQIVATKMICSNDVRRLSIEQRNCLYPEERSLKFFRKYADTNCLIECDALNFFRACGCVPFYFPFTNRPICNITKIPCLDEARQNSSKFMKNCNCLSQCDDDFYEVLSTTTKFEKDIEGLKSSFYQNLNLTQDYSILYVTFLGQTQTILFRDTITSTIYLLSSFGGVYSLFMGCSFVTIVEILYYIFLRLTVNMKIFGKIDNKQIKNEPRNYKQIYYGNEKAFLH